MEHKFMQPYVRAKKEVNNIRSSVNKNHHFHGTSKRAIRQVMTITFLKQTLQSVSVCNFLASLRTVAVTTTTTKFFLIPNDRRSWTNT